MAQGTFDILHPGHLHYLRESAALGDELVVVIARDDRIQERKDIYMDEESRRSVVAALEMVDEAVLGAEGDIFESVAELEPDIITLGHDQAYSIDALETELAEAGYGDIEVVRIGAYEGAGATSSSDIKDRVKKQSGPDLFTSVVGTDDI